VLKKLEDMGQLENTIVVFTTDNGAEVITFPYGGTTPFKGGKLTTWEGGMRAPCVVRWPGHIKPGTVRKEIFASLEVVALVDAVERRLDDPGYVPASICFFSPSPLGPPAMLTTSATSRGTRRSPS